MQATKRLTIAQDRYLSLPCSPDRAYAFFSRPMETVKTIRRLRRCELFPNGSVRWVLQGLPGIQSSFIPDYVVAYDCDGKRSVSWDTVAGNIVARGALVVLPSTRGGCCVHYREMLEAPSRAAGPAVDTPTHRMTLARSLELDYMFDDVADLLAN